MTAKTHLLSKLLFDSIQNSDFSLCKKLLKQGADPNLVLSEGASPFHIAVGDLDKPSEFTKLLLHYGGNPNIRSAEGVTPLHIATTYNCCEVVKLLLYNGADPLIKDQDGQTPLSIACGTCDMCYVTLQEHCTEYNSDQSEEGYYEYWEEPGCGAESRGSVDRLPSSPGKMVLTDQWVQGLPSIVSDFISSFMHGDPDHEYEGNTSWKTSTIIESQTSEDSEDFNCQEIVQRKHNSSELELPITNVEEVNNSHNSSYHTCPSQPTTPNASPRKSTGFYATDQSDTQENIFSYGTLDSEKENVSNKFCGTYEKRHINTNVEYKTCLPIISNEAVLSVKKYAKAVKSQAMKNMPSYDLSMLGCESFVPSDVDSEDLTLGLENSGQTEPTNEVKTLANQQNKHVSKLTIKLHQLDLRNGAGDVSNVSSLFTTDESTLEDRAPIYAIRSNNDLTPTRRGSQDKQPHKIKSPTREGTSNFKIKSPKMENTLTKGIRSSIVKYPTPKSKKKKVPTATLR